MIKWQTEQALNWNMTLPSGMKMVTYNPNEDKYVSNYARHGKLFSQDSIIQMINHVDMILSTNGVKPCTLQTPKACKLKNKLSMLDIGANMGVYSLGMAYEFERKYPFLNMVSFEPDRRNFALFTKSIQLNRVENIWAFPYALSDTQTMGQQMEFMIDAANKGHNHIVGNHSWAENDEKTVIVDGISLDLMKEHFEPKAVLKNCLWMKIDVEGFESHVFDGAKQYLSNDDAPCFIHTEFVTNKNDILSRLHDFGYLKVDAFDWNKIEQIIPLQTTAVKGYDALFVKNETKECTAKD